MTAPVPSLAEASAGIAAGTLSPVALTEAALARAAVVVPPERRAAMMEGFRAWLEMRKLLNEPMPLATEPAFALTQPAGPR